MIILLKTFIEENYDMQTLYKDVAERALLVRERFFQHLRRRFLMMQKTEQLLDTHMVGISYCNAYIDIIMFFSPVVEHCWVAKWSDRVTTSRCSRCHMI